MISISEYQDVSEHSPFHDWFEDLNSEAARKVTIALSRVGLGNTSSVKGVGRGVLELLRDYINATVGFPHLAVQTEIHAKTLHQMFGPGGNPTASKLFEIVSYLQRVENVQFEVRARRAALRPRKISHAASKRRSR
jgi:hypothetical protein